MTDRMMESNQRISIRESRREFPELNAKQDAETAEYYDNGRVVMARPGPGGQYLVMAKTKSEAKRKLVKKLTEIYRWKQ